MFKIITGDLLECKETYLCHQCNCLTNRSAHLASAIFSRFPYADVYTNRIEPDKPGTIELKGNGKDQRYVIAMFGQYYPGKTKYPNSTKDGWAARLSYFKSCLAKMEDLKGSFAFPWRIGCGLAGGDWESYLRSLQEFEKCIESDVIVYRLEAYSKPKDVTTLF